jgi:hypothetical protein
VSGDHSVKGIYNARPTTEFDTSATPFRIVNVVGDLIRVILECNDSHWIGVAFTKDRTKSRDLIGSLQVNVFAENLDVLLDPIYAHGFDFRELWDGDGRFV